MSKSRIAKLFKNGSSQAVRLPAEFRFEGDAVYVTRDEISGDLILSTRPSAKVWRDFFEMAHAVKAPAGFLSKRPMNALPRERNLFGGEE